MAFAEKPQVLIIEDQAHHASFYGLNFNAYLNCEVVVTSSFEEVESHLEKHPPAIILGRQTPINQSKMTELCHYLQRNEHSLALLSIGTRPVDYPQSITFKPGESLKHILKTSAQILGKTPATLLAEHTEKYFAIPLALFYPGLKVPFKIYKKKADKFKVAFYPGQLISQIHLKAFKKEALAELYIQSDVRLKFTDDLTQQLLDHLANSDSPSDIKAHHLASAHEWACDMARQLGITEKVIELTHSSIENLLKFCEDTPGLDLMLDTLLKGAGGHRFNMAFLSTYISTQVLATMGWQGQGQEKKLAFAAFFHDIALVSDEQAHYRSNEKLEKSKLPFRQQNLIKNHALLSSEIVKKYPYLPKGVETIIREHHGSISGKGLSVLNKNLHPLTTLFILADEYAYHLLTHPFNKENNQRALTFLFECYSLPSFTKFQKGFSWAS